MGLLRLLSVFFILSLPLQVNAHSYSPIQDQNERSVDKQLIVNEILNQIVYPASPMSQLMTPQVRFQNMRLPNAFVDQTETIVLSNQLLELTSSTDEIAFIVAHELGHIIFGHEHKAHSLDHELEADSFALSIMSSSELNTDAAGQIIRKVASFSLAPGIILADLYPSISSRILYLEG